MSTNLTELTRSPNVSVNTTSRANSTDMVTRVIVFTITTASLTATQSKISWISCYKIKSQIIHYIILNNNLFIFACLFFEKSVNKSTYRLINLTVIDVDKQIRIYLQISNIHACSKRSLHWTKDKVSRCLKRSTLYMWKIQLNNYIFIYEHYISFYMSTLATVVVGISRVTSPVTVTSLFVTRKVVQTVTTTVVDIIVFIGSVFTFCDNRFFFV